MELEVNQNHSWALCYDREDGLKNVVFHTFSEKPSAKEINAAKKTMSEKKGYDVKPYLWGPFDLR